MADFGENASWSGGDDGHGYRGMRNAREAAARRMERADLGFHEVRIEAGERERRMVGVDRDDKEQARYWEGQESRSSLFRVRVEVDMCCGVAVALYVSTRLSDGSQARSAKSYLWLWLWWRRRRRIIWLSLWRYIMLFTAI